MLGWSSSPVTTASVRNLLRWSRLWANSCRSILIATVRSIEAWRAAYTTPTPPSPITSCSWNSLLAWVISPGRPIRNGRMYTSLIAASGSVEDALIVIEGFVATDVSDFDQMRSTCSGLDRSPLAGGLVFTVLAAAGVSSCGRDGGAAFGAGDSKLGGGESS